MMPLGQYFDLVCLLIEERGGEVPLYTRTFQAIIITAWGQKLAATHVADRYMDEVVRRAAG